MRRTAVCKMKTFICFRSAFKYAHDYYKNMHSDDPERPPAVGLQEYLPESLQGRRYYEPGEQGKEGNIRRWLEKRRDGEA